MMDTGNITTAVFAAYLKCPTKGLLIARSEKPPQRFFGDLENSISEATLPEDCAARVTG